MRNITSTQKEAIILDAAVLFVDYGLGTQREIGITKGGVEFKVTENVRDIEYDGKRGKTKGMEVVDSIDAYLKVTTLEASQDNIYLTLGAATNAAGVITNSQGGVISDARYLTNVTAFGICNKSGTYKKITIKNVLAAGGLTLNTSDKSEAGLELTLNAHWDPASVSTPIYEIKDDTVGIVAQSALNTLVVTSTAGGSGDSVITVASTPAAGRGFVYKTGSAAVTVVFDDVLTTGWTALISGATITSADAYITVAEINGADNKAKAVGSTALNVGA